LHNLHRVRRPVSANFELSVFCQNKNSLELLNIIFENSSPKGFFWANKKKFEFSALSLDSRKLLTTALKGLLSDTEPGSQPEDVVGVNVLEGRGFQSSTLNRFKEISSVKKTSCV